MAMEGMLLQGRIEVITGSMFSGKTEELLKRMNRARFAHLRTIIFKPSIDTRFNESAVVSHDLNSIRSTSADHSSAILTLGRHAQVIGIDEAQFFDYDLVNVCNTLADQGSKVIVAGLDMDFNGTPFGPLPFLMAIADEVTKLHAVCVKCGRTALNSYRLGCNQEKIMLGEKEQYEPRCRNCFHLAE